MAILITAQHGNLSPVSSGDQFNLPGHTAVWCLLDCYTVMNRRQTSTRLHGVTRNCIPSVGHSVLQEGADCRGNGIVITPATGIGESFIRSSQASGTNDCHFHEKLLRASGEQVQKRGVLFQINIAYVLRRVRILPP
jgi:hypothetical protein